jgi:hypothetical protein
MLNAWHRLRPAPLPSVNTDGSVRMPRKGDDLFTEGQVVVLANDGVMPEGVLGGLYGRVQDLRVGKDYFMASNNLTRCEEEEVLLAKELVRLKAWITNMEVRCQQVWLSQRGDLGLSCPAAHDWAGMAQSGAGALRLEAGPHREPRVTQLARWHAGMFGTGDMPGLQTLLVYKYRRALAGMRDDLAPKPRSRRGQGRRQRAVG